MIKTKQIKIVFFLVLTGVSFNGSSQNSLEESKKRGEKIYEKTCVTCHMFNGEGMPRAFPPLAKSDYLMADTKRSIEIILNGVNGEMKVNGVTYYGAMVPYNNLTDQEIADVLNYIRNSWGNEGDVIEPKAVAKVRQ